MAIKIGYRWHLRRLMAERDMFATTDYPQHEIKIITASQSPRKADDLSE
jgi:hypothetical protein